MDVGYSSDWDSDEDEEEDDDFMDMDIDGTLPTYDEVLALDCAADPSHKPGAIKLPPLSSIPVFALEGVPEPTGRNGVPFMGRGTPVDRQRRADWATPPAPFIPTSLRFTPSQWSPTPPPTEYYSPSPEMAFSIPNTVQVNPGMDVGYDSAASMPMPMPIQVDLPMPAPTAQYGMSVNMNVVPQFEHQSYAQPVPECMPWLDPALRTESASPSPSPVPTAIVSHSISSSVSPPPYPSSQEYPTPIPVISTPSPDFGSSCSSTSVGSVSTSDSEAGPALGSPNSTGCAWHATGVPGPGARAVCALPSRSWVCHTEPCAWLSGRVCARVVCPWSGYRWFFSLLSLLSKSRIAFALLALIFLNRIGSEWDRISLLRCR
ncbi:hypothetical protein C8Q74DRAFT_673329 [Fomes fomentarius]|nr:hypothetical protein C8Q74DRAFT_673329 [Fomes fomentarius]